jgi:hypothetical protein
VSDVEEPEPDPDPAPYQPDDVIPAAKAGDRTREWGYRAVCDRHGWSGGMVRESEGFARQDAHRHNESHGHSGGQGATVRRVVAVRIGPTLTQVDEVSDDA